MGTFDNLLLWESALVMASYFYVVFFLLVEREILLFLEFLQ